MAIIRLQVDPDKMTLDDLIILEESPSNRQTRDILAKFCINEAGEYLPDEEAKKLVGSITLAELQTIGAQFREQTNIAIGTLIPKNQSSG